MPDNINTIAREVVDIYEKESNNGNAKRLQKLLSENEKAMDNLLKTLESGQAVDIIAERITPKKKNGMNSPLSCFWKRHSTLYPA